MARERSQRNRRESETERRRARQRRKQQKSRLLRILAAVGMGVLAVLIIAGLALPSFGGGQSGRLQDLIDRGGFLARPNDGPGQVFPDQGRVHLDAPSDKVAAGYYNSSPPTSGTHSPSWERCGIFTEPLPEELQVHNLEHGFINIQYNTDDAVLIGQLEAAARQLPDWPLYYVFAPYPNMDAAIALTAWNVALYLDQVDEDAMREFADAYQTRGPELARGCDAPGLMEAAAPTAEPAATVEPAATPEDDASPIGGSESTDSSDAAPEADATATPDAG